MIIKTWKMDIQVENCDKTRLIKGTPLNHILSTPIWLSCRQIGYEWSKESWMRRRCPALSLQKRFADPFRDVSIDLVESKLSQTPMNIRLNCEQEHVNNGIRGRKSLIAHLGCVNALAFGPSGSGTLISGGDDRRVLVWKSPQFEDNDKVRPNSLPGEHDSNIFCVDFNGRSETKIFSGGNDERVLVHDTNAGGRTQDIFLHEAAVYGVDGHPTNGDIFITACGDGRVQMFDLRQNPKELNDPLLVAVASCPFRPFLGAQFNPCEPRLLITANQKEGARLWDLRQPRKSVLEYGSVELGQYNGPRWHGEAAERCMSVRFNSTGTHIAALGRRMPPVVYELSSPKPFAEFDSPGYYNSCTMKSITFGGLDDSYILSGSDDFNLYIWKIPDDTLESSDETQLVNRASVILGGHRSIVNQVRYNPADGTIASAGVEKSIRLWSPFNVPTREQIAGRKDCEIGDYNVDKNNSENMDHSRDTTRGRNVSTRSNYLRLVQESHSILSHDYSNETTEENPRMLAFFDRLVQREMDDDRFSSSNSSSDGDGPGGTFRRATSPSSNSSNSLASHVSDLTDSDPDMDGDHVNYARAREQTSLNTDTPTSNNTTAIGRFIADFSNSISTDNQFNINNESSTIDTPSNGADQDISDPQNVVSIENNSSSDTEENVEEQSITISDLIAKKRQRLQSHHLKKSKRLKKLTGEGSSKMSENLLTYQSLQYQQKLKRAKKMVSLESSSSSSSYDASESDTEKETHPSSSKNQENYSNLSDNEVKPSSSNSYCIISNCDNTSDKNPSIRTTDQLTIPNKSTQDDAKMRLSILRALREYEEEESLKETAALSCEDDLSGLKSNHGSIAKGKIQESSSPDIASLKITCSKLENNSSEQTDKKTLQSYSMKDNSIDNVQNSCLDATAATKTSSYDTKLPTNFDNSSAMTFISDENRTDSILEESDSIEKVQFKKGSGLGKGKRCYRKRKVSED